MSILTECWNNIIGISRKNDDCISDDRPADYNVSKSGLYLDELKGINLRFVNETGGYTDLWTKCQVSIENAIRTFKIDVISELLKKNKERYETFIGNIGSQRFKSNLSITNTYAGVRMYCNDISGGIFKLTHIGVIMDKTETFDIDIYSNLDDSIIETISVDSIAGQLNKIALTTPIELPLSDDNYDNLEYYFIYPITDKQPKNNLVTCGCNGVTWCFNTQKPCFANKAKKDRWRQWAMVGGITGNDISNRENWGISEYMNGLILIGELKCDKFIYLCNENSDYETEIDQAIAYSVLYKAGEFLMDEFIDNEDISRYTALGKEALINSQEYYNQRYTVMINFIASNLDISQYSCLECTPAKGFQLRQQFITDERRRI
jgi:hypothetical protein